MIVMKPFLTDRRRFHAGMVVHPSEITGVTPVDIWVEQGFLAHEDAPVPSAMPAEPEPMPAPEEPQQEV